MSEASVPKPLTMSLNTLTLTVFAAAFAGFKRMAKYFADVI
jgi:hypothetical protein